MITIPIIDLSPFMEKSCELNTLKESVVANVAEACEEYGMFHVILNENPGSIFSKSELALMAAKRLFSLSEEVKLEILVGEKGPNRGYIAVGGESGSGSFEYKEGFSYGKEWVQDYICRNALEEVNAWPLDENFNNPEGKQRLTSYFDWMNVLVNALTRALSLAMGQQEDYLSGYCKDGDRISLMRCFHYFGTGNDEKPETSKKTGSSPHTDWGLCTLITQSSKSEPALQVFNKGEYVDVVPRYDCLVANCGDYLSLLTNGRFKSPLHRVVLTKAERYSLVYFAYPNFEATVPKGLGDHQLSLLTDQSESASPLGQDILKQDQTFGEFIAEKWVQVRRTARGSLGNEL